MWLGEFTSGLSIFCGCSGGLNEGMSLVFLCYEVCA